MKKIILWVLSIHLALLVVMITDHLIKQRKAPKKAMTVRTVQMQKPMIANLSNVSQNQAKSNLTKPIKEKPIPAAAPQSKNKPKPSSKASNKPSNPSKTALLPPASTSPTPTPKEEKKDLPIPKLEFAPASPQIAAATNEEILDFRPDVASYLHEALILPEFGEVKIAIVVSKDGKVSKIEVLESKSRKNEEFLKNRLSEMFFPWLNEETKLTLVIKNE
jgi:hypothetical protein